MNEVNNPDTKISADPRKESCFHVEKPTALNPDIFKTTNSDINAFVGKVSTKGKNIFCLQRVRTALMAGAVECANSTIAEG